MRSSTDIKHMFESHQPTDETAWTHADVRDRFTVLARALNRLLPEGSPEQFRCKALAMTKLEEAAMWANKSVAYLSKELSAKEKI